MQSRGGQLARLANATIITRNKYKSFQTAYIITNNAVPTIRVNAVNFKLIEIYQGTVSKFQG